MVAVRVGTAIALALLTLTLIIGKAGVWPLPALRMHFDISQSLTRNPLVHSNMHFLFTSYLQPAVFGLLGGDSLTAYFVYCAVLALTFMVVLLWALVRMHGPSWKLVAVAVFPVMALPFYWVGVDGATLLLLLVTTLALHSRLAPLCALLLSWQHFEQGFVAFLLLGVTFVATRNTGSLLRTALVLVVLLAGKLAMVAYFHFVGVQLAVDRVTFVRDMIHESLRQWRLNWPVMMWSVLGAGWIFVLVTVRRSWPVLIAAPLAFLVLLVVVDQTRVGAMILFPVVVYWILFNRPLWVELRWVLVVAVLALYLLVPFIFMWTGIPCYSVMAHTLEEVGEGFRRASRGQGPLRIDQFKDYDFIEPYLDAVTGACPRSTGPM
jgi:hypothetical protein